MARKFKKPRIEQIRQQLQAKDRRMRMMWNSNSVWSNSGYAVEQRDMLFRFIKDGWKVAQSCFFGLEGSPIGINGLTCYPKMQDTWGSDAMFYHGQHFGANVVFSMQDIWPLNPQFLQQIKYWIPYVPVDQEPVPPGVVNNLRYAYKIVTFSQFGKTALQRRGFSSTLIREGTDINIFKPMDKLEARKELNLPPDAFVCGMIGANKETPSRKGWQESLDAFELFLKAHPEAIFFYQTNQPSPGGFQIIEYANDRGFGDKIRHLDDYQAIFHTSSPQINTMLNAFDILLHPSMNEGFGLVIVEAQATGTPVIINNCTSMPELIVEGVTGEIAKTKHKMRSLQGGDIYFADAQDIYEKMEMVYKRLKDDPQKVVDDCRNHIVKNFNIDTIVQEQWLPFLETLQNEILPPLGALQENLPEVQLSK